VFKRRITLFKALAALAALPLIFLVIERVRGQISLGRYQRQLVSRGEKLTAREFATPFDARANGAPEVIAAINRLSNGIVLPGHAPSRMRLTPSGRAVVAFRQNEWVDAWEKPRVTNRWDQLAADLKTNEAVLAAIRAGLAKPVFNNEVDLTQVKNLKIQHAASVKRLSYWLGGAGMLALHEGNPHAALPDLVEQIRLSRLLAEDHLLISELVRMALGTIARSDTWEALQADGWTDEDLVALQKAWEGQEFAVAMGRSLEGERVFAGAAFEMMRESNPDAITLLFGLEHFLHMDEESSSWNGIASFFKEQVYCRIWRFAWSYQAQERNLETTQRLIEIARKAAAEKSFASVREAIARHKEESNNRNLYDKVRFPDEQSLFTLSDVVIKSMRIETERSMTLCAIAIKRHSLRHGRPPASLEALVPDYLPAVPIDFMDGKPLKYRLNADGSYTLYSVGEDGKDDGGDAILPPGEMSRNPWKRKDFVWPAPALSGESAVDP
jgi:hypothetical protein